MSTPGDTGPVPPPSNSDLPLRVASAIVLIVVAVWVTWAGGALFQWAMIALSAVVFYEWTRITMLPAQARSVWLAGAGLLVSIATLLVFGMTSAWIVAIAWALALVSLAGSHVVPKLQYRRAKWATLGLLYAFASGTTLIVIRGASEPVRSFEAIGTDTGLVLLSFLFLIVWATDIFAYFTGRHFGGPKLWPAVSPKKTWSGAIGGAFSAAIVGALFGSLLDDYALFTTIALAVVLSAVSQLGDLFESWVKRRYEVKDSSRLIPGHGGFMDRIDGLVFAAVPLALFVALYDVA